MQQKEKAAQPGSVGGMNIEYSDDLGPIIITAQDVIYMDRVKEMHRKMEAAPDSDKPAIARTIKLMCEARCIAIMKEFLPGMPSFESHQIWKELQKRMGAR